MADTAISGLPDAGALTGAELFELVQSGANVKDDLATLGGAMASPMFTYLNANYTLTSSTAQQKLFNTTTNGTLTLPSVGLYEWDLLAYLTGMSATSGNGAVSLIGAGTAVLAGQLMHAVGLDSTTPATAAAQGGAGVMGGNAFTTNTVTAATGTALIVNIRGVFKCTTAGTIIPSIALQTAAAAVVNAGSFFRARKIAESAVYSRGSWS